MVCMSKVSKALHCNKCMYLGKYMYLLNVGHVEINCTDCKIFYGTHVEGVEGITL